MTAPLLMSGCDSRQKDTAAEGATRHTAPAGKPRAKSLAVHRDHFAPTFLRRTGARSRRAVFNAAACPPRASFTFVDVSTQSSAKGSITGATASNPVAAAGGGARPSNA